MKRLIPMLLIAVAGAVAAYGQTPEKEVLAAMDAWKQAMIHRDSAGLEKYLHEGVIYSHSDGHTRQNKAEAIAAVMSGKPSIDAMEFPDPTVKVFGDTALVKGRLDITTSQDGKSSTGHVDRKSVV